jgi:DNA polymerase-1
MVEIHTKYKNNNSVRLLLQIHDELIFEIREDMLEETTKDLKEIMENIYTLNIPLKVSLSIGNSWQELK